ncbi:MAG: helix-turn-helix domain-containing protein [Bacteroidales bacterium]|nr:helix-turn-helix domain-containing protein [Bacteroidales bacterium]
MKTPENPQLQLAFDFVQYTGNNIFLTGKAGTGKTTFLHNLKKLSPKRMVVVAPTGVAAINAGGVTIHSFFQLPLGPQVPGYESEGQAVKFKRFRKEKINIMKSLDLLVIDEISMVRADVLDGVDATLRRFRNRELPFGGVQLLMIGDLQQLAPVVKEDEWALLKQHYNTAFFFGSKALNQTQYISIELQHVYRQSDQEFIALLNSVRDNKLGQEVIDVLNTRYQPGFKAEDEGYITLTTHNKKAQNINETRLKILPGRIHSFNAEVIGNFPEYNFPTAYELQLKEGAQVMFIKNDPTGQGEYYNGKIGKVTGFEDEKVIVQCPDNDFPITVEPLEWQNVKYNLDGETKEITEEIEGRFTQMPLKLAWAITIHKSQGLTFEKAIIDAQAAFAHGQVYVALSRCKSLEGLVLSSRIGSASIKNDPGIGQFTREVEENQPDRQSLEASKRQYEEQVLCDLFDYNALQRLFYQLNNKLNKNAINLDRVLLEQYKQASVDCRNHITGIGEKFKAEIRHLLKQHNGAENNAALQQRLAKAIGYFDKQLTEKVIDLVNDTSIETDNREVRKVITEALEKLYEEAVYKQKCLSACRNGFVLKDYLKDRAKASIDETPSRKKKESTDAYEELKNADLYNVLKAWRDAKMEELDWESYMVLPVKTMRALCNEIPSNRKSLKAVKGFGKKKLERFGDELLEILIRYRRENNMDVLQPEDPEEKPRKPKIDTKMLSFDLWKSGKNIQQVAEERNFAVSTIEGHLAHFVEKGEVDVNDLVSEDKVRYISDYFLNHDSGLLNEAKSALGDEVSYGELRLVLSHLRYQGKIGVSENQK